MAWETDDLLFISNYGEGDERQISFAHFSQDKGGGLATLKVLGWDNLDTPLHLDAVAEALIEHFAGLPKGPLHRSGEKTGARPLPSATARPLRLHANCRFVSLH